MNVPKKDDPHHFHFVYACKKQVDPVVDTDELEKEEEFKKNWFNMKFQNSFANKKQKNIFLYYIILNIRFL